MMKKLNKEYAIRFWFTYADKVRVICDARKCC